MTEGTIKDFIFNLLYVKRVLEIPLDTIGPNTEEIVLKVLNRVKTRQTKVSRNTRSSTTL